MTHQEQAAYAAGITFMADLATRSTDVLRAKITVAPTRYSFAIAALDAVADEGRAMVEDLGDESNGSIEGPNAIAKSP